MLVGSLGNRKLDDNKTISEVVQNTVGAYLEDMGEEEITDLYALVQKEVEAPLFFSVLHHTGYNQSKTASILGLSRGTLRKKLRKYRLL